MRITVLVGSEEHVLEVDEGSSSQAIMAHMDLRPDAYLVLRTGVPIPVDEPLGEGESIKLIRVASGG
jgi:sulfur carrier protein ThiS